MRKADFQMSMGLIVAVVFAIILLSLSITWIQGLFSDIATITHKTTDVAQQQLLKELASSGKKVGIAAPAVTTWGKGETGSYSVGIKNTDVDKAHTYYVNVYLEAVGGDLSDESVSSVDNEYDVNSGWLTYPAAKDIADGDREIIDLIIKPTMGSGSGIYTFTIAVCDKDNEMGYTGYLNCKTTSPNLNYEKSDSLYGSATFTIELKQ